MFFNTFLKLSIFVVSSIGISIGGYFLYESLKGKNEETTLVIGDKKDTVSGKYSDSSKKALELHSYEESGKTKTCVFCGNI